MLVVIVIHQWNVAMANTAPQTTHAHLVKATTVINAQIRPVFAGHARMATESVQTVFVRS
jgi:hypothetical protein